LGEKWVRFQGGKIMRFSAHLIDLKDDGVFLSLGSFGKFHVTYSNSRLNLGVVKGKGRKCDCGVGAATPCRNFKFQLHPCEFIVKCLKRHVARKHEMKSED
jgi:hypothetical protein